jgi:hypothetical protein
MAHAWVLMAEDETALRIRVFSTLERATARAAVWLRELLADPLEAPPDAALAAEVGRFLDDGRVLEAMDLWNCGTPRLFVKVYKSKLDGDGDAEIEQGDAVVAERPEEG